MSSRPSVQGFTLIELLVVIAIIAILAVVVVLTLNPAELLRQAHDANRLSDMATLNSAISLYNTDQSGASGYTLGNASSVYISLPDTSGTCSNLGLPTTPTGYTYACSSATSSRLTNGSGWIPINLSNISSGSPLGSLPVDPTNSSSSGLYYTYYTSGNQFEVTSLFESQKYKAQYAQSPIVQSYPEVNAKGSSLSIDPLFNPSGLVGWWPLTEGSGSSSIDQSGNGNNGTWSGNASGTNNTYYSPGKVGAWAGYFNGSNDYVNMSSTFWNPSSTWAAWVNYSLVGGYNPIFETGGASDGAGFVQYGSGNVSIVYNHEDWERTSFIPSAGQWYYLVWTKNTSASQENVIYLNGVPLSLVYDPGDLGFVPTGGEASRIGRAIGSGAGFISGLIDDVRIYNRALSAAEVQALYNAEK